MLLSEQAPCAAHTLGILSPLMHSITAHKSVPSSAGSKENTELSRIGFSPRHDASDSTATGARMMRRTLQPWQGAHRERGTWPDLRSRFQLAPHPPLDGRDIIIIQNRGECLGSHEVSSSVHTSMHLGQLWRLSRRPYACSTSQAIDVGGTLPAGLLPEPIDPTSISEIPSPTCVANPRCDLPLLGTGIREARAPLSSAAISTLAMGALFTSSNSKNSK
ncbi:hypothetical protein BD309DRAFT_658747 [Dichomitus squalens]|nr:hypothetical protein BD309DRAFT_658747 [Dichomitus squalens]